MRIFYGLVILGIALAIGYSIDDAYGAGFVKFYGIDGESKDKDHAGWCDLLSVSDNLSTRTSTSQRTAGVSEEIVISKTLDKASPKLAESIVTGKVFPSVLINLCESGQGCYLKYELTNVMVTSYSVSGDADDRPTEQISLNFEKLTRNEQTQTKEKTHETKQEQSRDTETKQEQTRESEPAKESMERQAAIKQKPRVPDWVQSTARFWVDKDVSDREFTDALGFLVKEKIIDVEVESQETTQEAETTKEPQVPDWISQTTDWWINGEVPEDQFLEGIKWMIKNKIIRGI